MSTYDAARTELERQLSRLLGRADRIEGDLRQPHDRDWPEQATERENDDVLQGLDTLSRGEAERIRAALQRIDAGTYGACATCGEVIGAERRAAMPSAITCLACAPEQRRSA